MNDVMAQLAKANQVRVEDLAPLDLPDLTRRPTPGRRFVLAAALAAAVAAAAIGVVLTAGTNSHRSGSGSTGPIGPTAPQGPTGPLGPPGPTIAVPIPDGKKVTLPAAAAVMGMPL